MAETVNIAAMAEKISEKIFSKFGWQLTGPTNQNFACCRIEEHQKKSSPSHPVDAVFSYQDPYEGEVIHLLTDLKSYAKDTIKSTDFAGPLRDLAKSVDCANISEEWQESYANPETHYQVHGLLFVYNHDAEYDADFGKHLKANAHLDFHLPRGKKLFVIGPDRINYLLSVVIDVALQQSDQILPIWDKIPILYPDRVRHAPGRLAQKRTVSVARIESLLGPILLVPYVSPKTNEEGISIYYDGTGENWEEFTFLLDFCFKAQLVGNDQAINIRMARAASNAIKQFEVAKENFKSNFYPEFNFNRLDQFSVSPIDGYKKVFETAHVGMERRK